MASGSVEYERTVKGITLELSAAEAKTLHSLVRSVGGSRTHSPGRHAEAIRLLMEELGVDFHDYSLLKGAVYFKDEM